MKPVEVDKIGGPSPSAKRRRRSRASMCLPRGSSRPITITRRLASIVPAEPYADLTPRVESQYVAGRNIGDEYRYIIDRKFARKFPGNMLERPSLLLNPWAIRSTETGQQEAQRGEAFARARPAPAKTVSAA